MYLSNKISDRLDKIFSNIGDPFIANLNIRKDIEDKLLQYQLLHVFNMLTALDLNTVILDCSDTGTGKTYTTIATILQKGLIPFIISPKAAKSTWVHVCKYFDCKYIDIINYESVLSKYPDWPNIGNRNSKIVFVFDEVHKCKNPKTISSLILMKTKFLPNKKILISATLVDKITDFAVFGYMLEFYSNIKKGPRWIKNITEEYNNSLTNSNPLKNKIFPYKGSKMSIKEINDFPTQKIILHKLISDKDVESKWKNITDIIQIRMSLESEKIEEFYNLTIDYLDNDLSVVVFINYLCNMKKLSALLRKNRVKHHLLSGEVGTEDRSRYIEEFQRNEVHVIICTYGTGGASISLHDLYGRGRASIISLPESSIDFNQALGRLVRAGSKSTAIQIIPIYGKTYERVMYLRIKEKIKNLNQLGDCNLADIEF